jgi:two-component system, NarL family, nitrate/nitrite response regulator NarL
VSTELGTPVRVALVGDDALARNVLRVALERNFTIAGEGSTSTSSTLLDQHDPDVLVWDLGVDGVSGLEKLNQVELGEWPAVLLVPDARASDVSFSRTGAHAVIDRTSAPEKMNAAVLAVDQGFYVAEHSTFFEPRAPGSNATESMSLTPRENEVLQLLAQGLSNKSIAHRLSVSEHTAKFHINAIFSKLNAQTRTEAVVRAAQLGWVML